MTVVAIFLRAYLSAWRYATRSATCWSDSPDGVVAFVCGSYWPLPSVGIRTPDFIKRAFLIQRERCGLSLTYMPAAIAMREPTCVRFGPMVPTASGFPATVWQ